MVLIGVNLLCITLCAPYKPEEANIITEKPQKDDPPTYEDALLSPPDYSPPEYTV